MLNAKPQIKKGIFNSRLDYTPAHSMNFWKRYPYCNYFHKKRQSKKQLRSTVLVSDYFFN